MEPPASPEGLSIPGLSDLTPVGRGASSTVYRAYDAELNRWVAVKVLLADDPSDPARKRFQREREITANLGKHPHIVQVLTTGFTPSGLAYVVMELYERGSIADRIRLDGAFTVADVLDIGIKIADAVEAAHRAGVLHRDIKPANILISEYGPALADFGIARTAANLEWSQSLEQLTPMHAGPEILLGDEPSVQADIYALGSTLYTMLAGRPPFAGPAGESLLRYQVRVAQESVPSFARTDVPDELRDVILRCLEKDPADRFSSAVELRDALRGVTGASGSSPKGKLEVAEETVARPSVQASPAVPFLPDPTADTGRYSGAEFEPTYGNAAAISDASDVAGRLPMADEPPTIARVRIPAPVEEPTGEVPPRKRRRLVALVAGVVILGAVGGIVVSLMSKKTPVSASGTGATKSSSASPKSKASTSTTPTTSTTAEQTGSASIYTLAGAPTNVGANIAPDGTSVSLHWTDHTKGTAQYVVFGVDAAGAKTKEIITAAGADAVSVDALTPNVGYCFVVLAFGEATHLKYAPGCACVHGEKLTHTQAGFPAISCT